MLKTWILLALTPLVSICHVLGNVVDPNFQNTAVVRTIDVGGSTTHVTTSFQFKAVKNGKSTYYFALSPEDAARTSWIDAKLKGQQEPLDVEALAFASKNDVRLYHVTLPKALKVGESATLIVNAVQSHASYPLPASIKQNEPQSLVYQTEVYVISPYETELQRLKLRGLNPKIISWDEPKELSKYLPAGEEKVASKSGAAVTYGPFKSFPPSASRDFIEQDQQKIKLHYEYDGPVLTVQKLLRSAEISHWGANLNIQDAVWLKNDGAALKGHFSRIEHAKQTMRPQLAMPHILKNVVLHLPADVRDPYFYDIVGNVSTSHFRPAPPARSGSLRSSPLSRNSILDLKPRYPLLGGWNYTFTIGYDMPLGDWVRYDPSGSYVAAVPFLTPIPGAAYDEVEVTVVLPEGATVEDIHPPFAPDVIERITHVTYLDTAGRPAVVLRLKNATDKHAGLIYITYRVSTLAHLRKPFAVGVSFFGMLCLGMVLRRINFSIRSPGHPKKRS